MFPAAISPAMSRRTFPTWRWSLPHCSAVARLSPVMAPVRLLTRMGRNRGPPPGSTCSMAASSAGSFRSIPLRRSFWSTSFWRWAGVMFRLPLRIKSRAGRYRTPAAASSFP